MVKDFELHNSYQQMKIAIIIAITIGSLVSVFFIVIEKESYSAIYLFPNSIIHNPDDNTVLYVYGVKSSESQKMDYILDTYVDDNLIKSKQFSLNKGETMEERVIDVLPSDTSYPKKITLTLKNGQNTESVHFWINNITSEEYK